MKFSITFICIAVCSACFAQTRFQSNRNSLPVYSNPALTGTGQGARAIYGSEFNFQSNPFFENMNYVSFDLPVKKLHGGLGIQLYKESNKYNLRTENTVTIAYTFHQKLNEKWALSTGGSIGLSKENIDFNAFDHVVKINSLDPEFRLRFTHLVGSTGFTIYSDNLYFGTSLHFSKDAYLTINNPSSTRLFDLQFGYKLSPFKNENFYLLPLVSYQRMNGFNSIKGQLSFTMNKITIGIYSQQHESSGFFVGLNLKQFDLRYGLQETFSPLSNNSHFRGHNVSLGYSFHKLKSKNSTPIQFQLF